MAWFNPHKVDFNYDTRMIDAVGAVGKSLWDIYKTNVEKNQNQAKLDETNRANLATEGLYDARNQETARHNLAGEAETARKNAFDQSMDINKFNLDRSYKGALMNNMAQDNARGWAQLAFNKQQAQDKDAAETQIALARSDLLNKTDVDTASLLGVDEQNLNAMRENLRQKGFSDDQISNGINQYVKTRIGTLGGTYWSNPLGQQEVIEARKRQNQEQEDNIASAVALARGNINIRRQLGKKYNLDFSSLSDEQMTPYIKKEMQPGGSLNPKIIAASTKNVKGLTDNLSTISIVADIANGLSKGAQEETGTLGIKPTLNNIAKFLNSDNPEATRIRAQIDALRVKMAKTARSNAVLEQMNAIMPKYGDASTNNFLSTLSAAAYLANTDIDSAIKVLPNGVYSDDLQDSLKNLDVPLNQIADVTGIDPRTMRRVSNQRINIPPAQSTNNFTERAAVASRNDAGAQQKNYIDAAALGITFR